MISFKNIRCFLHILYAYEVISIEIGIETKSYRLKVMTRTSL